MVDTNEHTGSRMVSKVPSEDYKNNFDRIFRNKQQFEEPDDSDKQCECPNWTLGCCGNNLEE